MQKIYFRIYWLFIIKFIYNKIIYFSSFSKEMNRKISMPEWIKRTEPMTKLIPAIRKAPESISISSRFLFTLAAITIYLIGL